MTWAPRETQKTIYEILSADAQLQIFLGGSPGDVRIYDNVPDKRIYPFVVVGAGAWNDRGNHSWDGWDVRLQLDIWYRAPERGRLAVQNIQARIDQLLHRVDICVDGWNVIVCRRQLVDIFYEEDNVTLHGVQIYKLQLGEI